MLFPFMAVSRHPGRGIQTVRISPNRFGLIDNLDDARRANDYLLEAGAEPAIWETLAPADYTEGINRGRRG